MRDSVIELGSPSVFSIEEANARVRIILRFTKDVSKNVDQLLARLEALDPQEQIRTKSAEAEVESVIESWNAKVKKLGGVPKGLWLADFDSGDGFFCWKYPESEIKYWHSRDCGFTGRISLQDREKRLITKHEDRSSTDQFAPR